MDTVDDLELDSSFAKPMHLKFSDTSITSDG